jgi:hypothetical protein
LFVILSAAMNRFYITAIRNAGKPGRAGWMVSYAVRDPERKGKCKRRQNMFLDFERATEFLEEARREFLNTGRIDLAKDRLLQCDVLRGLKILATVPNASFEVAAWLLKICRGARELRGAKYEVPMSRQIELEPRAFLGCNNKARSVGIALKDLVNAIVLQWLEREAEARVEERIEREAREERLKVGLRWKDWRETKAHREREEIHRKLREIAEEYRKLERRKEVGEEERGNGS